MPILCFGLLLLAVYGGAVDLPMLSSRGFLALIGFGFTMHVLGELHKDYWRWRNHHYHGAAVNIPNTERKAVWVDTFGNLFGQWVLLIVGAAVPLCHVALAGWFAVDVLSHAETKWTKHRKIGMMSFRSQDHPPGFLSACLVLLPLCALFMAVNWPTREAMELVGAFLAGTIPFMFNYLMEARTVRLWNGKRWDEMQKVPEHMWEDLELRRLGGHIEEIDHTKFYTKQKDSQ